MTQSVGPQAPGDERVGDIRRWRKRLDNKGSTWSHERVGTEFATALEAVDYLLSLFAAAPTPAALSRMQIMDWYIHHAGLTEMSSYEYVMRASRLAAAFADAHMALNGETPAPTKGEYPPDEDLYAVAFGLHELLRRKMLCDPRYFANLDDDERATYYEAARKELALLWDKGAVR